VTFSVTAGDPWWLTGLPDWVHASLVAGPSGTTQVTLTVDPWSGSDSRQVTLTVGSAGQTATVTLGQGDVSWVGLLSWIADWMRQLIASLLAVLSQFFWLFGLGH
jgi:hypothetical protein